MYFVTGGLGITDQHLVGIPVGAGLWVGADCILLSSVEDRRVLEWGCLEGGSRTGTMEAREPDVIHGHRGKGSRGEEKPPT